MNNKDFEVLKELKKLKESSDTIIKSGDFYRENKNNLNTLRIGGLINYVGHFNFTVTELSYKISKYISWQGYNNSQIEKENQNTKKDKYDYLFSKYRYKTFWFGFVLGTLGGLYGIYDAFIKAKNQ